eukprot:4577977-Pyramimonas_sp.AAC.1
MAKYARADVMRCPGPWVPARAPGHGPGLTPVLSVPWAHGGAPSQVRPLLGAPAELLVSPASGAARGRRLAAVGASPSSNSGAQ